MPRGKYVRTSEIRNKTSESMKGKEPWNKGKHLSEEHKKRIGKTNKIAQKGKKLSEETKQKISEAKKGHTVSEETKRKISEANKGHTVSEETRKKMSEAAKGRIPWNKGLRKGMN